jgi:hypothetical protein
MLRFKYLAPGLRQRTVATQKNTARVWFPLTRSINAKKSANRRRLDAVRQHRAAAPPAVISLLHSVYAADHAK